MVNGPGVQGDLQATRDLLARAVERLDHMGNQQPPRARSQQPPHERSQQPPRERSQQGRAYLYNPIPGPSLVSFPDRNETRPSHETLNYYSKIAMCQHLFVCLADVGQTRVPCTFRKGQIDASWDWSKGRCIFGVGRKLGISPRATRKQAGGYGYELLRTSERSNKELAVIPPPSGGYTG